MVDSFKTAVFKIHNPSQHKLKLVRYALEHYHLTAKQLLETILALPNLMDLATSEGKKDGILRFDAYKLDKTMRTFRPQHPLAGKLWESVLADVNASLGSYIAKNLKGDDKCNPPTFPSLEPPTETDIKEALLEFVSTEHLPDDEQQEEIEKVRNGGQVHRADRLWEIYSSRAASKAIGKFLRSTEAARPRPLKFVRTRDFTLAKRGSKYFLLTTLFEKNHRYNRTVRLEDGFTDVVTREDLSGSKHSGLIFPLEMGRFHERDFFASGRPQTLNLQIVPSENGQNEIYASVPFKFSVPEVIPQSVIGIDRGAVKLGVACLLDLQGNELQRIELDGRFFHARVRHYKEKIAKHQQKQQPHEAKRFHRKSRQFVASKVHEYVNQIIRLARKHRSMIVLEDLTCSAMVRWLSPRSLSQYRKIEFLLGYKAARYGLLVMKVPAPGTSQTCPMCGHRAKENRLSQALFLCVNCGYGANADHNASYVVGLRGLHQHLLSEGLYVKFDAFQQWLRSWRQKGNEVRAFELATASGSMS